MPTLASIPFTTSPYVHAWNTGTGLPPQLLTYSGRYIVAVQEWGMYSVNADTGVFKMISPVGKFLSPFQPPHTGIHGDCWQSGVAVWASPTTENWILVLGAPNCPVDGSEALDPPFGFPADSVQVLKLDPTTGPHFWGSVNPPVGRFGPVVSIDDIGGTAWIAENFAGTLFSQIDLNALTILQEHVAIPPTPTVWQTDIDGFTYGISAVIPSPPPQPYPGPDNFIATRSDQSGPPGPPGGGFPIINFTVEVAPIPSPLASLVQTSGGTGYTTATADVHGGGGSGATVNVVVNMDGSLTLTLGSPGSGYVSQPTVVITGDGHGAAAILSLPPPSGQSVEYFATNHEANFTTSIGISPNPPYSLAWRATQVGQLTIEAKLTRGPNQYSAFLFITVNQPPLVIQTMLSSEEVSTNLLTINTALSPDFTVTIRTLLGSG